MPRLRLPIVLVSRSVNIALSVAMAVAGPLTNAVGFEAVLVGMSILIGLVSIWAWQNTRRVSQNV